jgi:membrane protein YdbS with pleckstrin-like domain
MRSYETYTSISIKIIIQIYRGALLKTYSLTDIFITTISSLTSLIELLEECFM